MEGVWLKDRASCTGKEATVIDFLDKFLCFFFSVSANNTLSNTYSLVE